MQRVSRREFLDSALAAAAFTALSRTPAIDAAENRPTLVPKFGMVTYQWGNDWDLPTLLGNCIQTKVLGVELRTTHAHGVEPKLNELERKEVRKRFADSPVTLVGLGSAECFDHVDPAALKKAVEATKEFIRLSHDVGGSGVKVRPNSFHKEVPREKTIDQIGRALNELGPFAESLGQQIRLEVHGQCAQLPTIKAIMDIAVHRSVAVCWNSNAQDLEGEGLEHNFNLVRARFGGTCHVRELDTPGYPFQGLMELLVKTNYNGWVLLEAGSKQADRVAALARQREYFEKMIEAAKASLAQK